MATEWRIGIGYDIHAVVADRSLILGGVAVVADFGLGGHTDGDVVLHAMIDAMCGAAGLPDIGEQFPDDDPELAGRCSTDLLMITLQALRARRWEVGNVDLTIHAERPILSSYKPAIRESLANLLRTEPERISVKAKTNEGFDAVGQGRAISCEVALTVKRESE